MSAFLRACAIPLVLAVPALQGCAAYPRYRYAERGKSAAAPAEAIKFCKLEATARSTNFKIDALPPDPSAKAELGAFIGNSIGGSIGGRRAYKKCMEKLGYVRLD